MIEIRNDERYISEATLNKCFESGKHLRVDKVITGNGFSTSFLKKAPRVGKINIMIAPNKAVIIDKEQAYLSGALETPNNIGFFYKEGINTISENHNLMIFVADSFYLYSKQLYKIRRKINWILIDEAHSIEIQSSFRWVLRDFDAKVERYLNDEVAITSVTATPNHFTPVDIKIINSHVIPQLINVTSDRVASIERVKADLHSSRKVVVATNSMSVIYRLRNRERELTANFIMGVSLFRSCVMGFKLNQDPDSNLIIISSRGFEGFDILDEGYKVYFFEDRGKEHETFFISNLYQAINRTRKGADYIEYSVRYMADERKISVTEEAIDKFIASDKITVEGKQKKEHEKFHPFIIFTQDKEGTFTMKKDVVSINLRNEKSLYDSGFDEFDSFLDDRSISINYLEEKQVAVPNLRIPIEIKKENLLRNKDMINRMDLFGEGFNIVIRAFDKYVDYKKHLEVYLIRKVFDVGMNKVDENGVRELNDREVVALDLLTNEAKFDRLVGKITRAYNKRSIEKYGKAKSKKYRDEFKDKNTKIVGQLVIAFMNSHIIVPPNWVANRNYNLLTQIGMDEINILGEAFDTSIQEIDIKGAFPRIIYSKNNLALPEDFYGKDKMNKIKINVTLNNFFYDKTSPIEYRFQKRNAIVRFERLGFDPDVIDYLIDNFFDNEDRGSLFHFLSFYEKKLISAIKEIFEQEDNIGVIRRHDSVLILGDERDVSFLNQFEYLGVKGWFKINENKEIVIENKLFDEHKEAWE